MTVIWQHVLPNRRRVGSSRRLPGCGVSLSGTDPEMARGRAIVAPTRVGNPTRRRVGSTARRSPKRSNHTPEAGDWIPRDVRQPPQVGDDDAVARPVQSVPTPSSLRNVIVPSWASMIRLTIVSPRPTPSPFWLTVTCRSGRPSRASTNASWPSWRPRCKRFLTTCPRIFAPNAEAFATDNLGRQLAITKGWRAARSPSVSVI
jgi:hypothetical protein